ncbi:hypothetical protein B0T14DRAFT_134865 [Immersiella caudata]|uniref:gluconokinase n=1 Tax=Immersiella caudata TaxID=314043 RepID=A0AA39X5J2_9PEZI|nr:hypothetical protein B0T14DRAFT_134865 [Immersiella caudata]
MGDTAQTDKHHGHRWIWFATGPAACGKTTIAKALAEDLHFTFLEGDDYHPKANIDKMSRGDLMTDEDRKGWLEALRDHETAQPSGPNGPPHLVLLGCTWLDVTIDRHLWVLWREDSQTWCPKIHLDRNPNDRRGLDRQN